MEACKELSRQKWNEEKRQEIITCFQTIWTTANIFGHLGAARIKWNVTPHLDFLPKELGAWMTPPIRIHKLSQCPDSEADFAARLDFSDFVHNFVQGIGANWQPTMQSNDNLNSQGETNTKAPDNTSNDPPMAGTPDHNTDRQTYHQSLETRPTTTTQGQRIPNQHNPSQIPSNSTTKENQENPHTETPLEQSPVPIWALH